MIQKYESDYVELKKRADNLDSLIKVRKDSILIIKERFYVYKNREKYTVLKKVGTIIFLNLIPFYETYSDQLKTLGLNLIDKKNQDIIIEITSKHKNVIVAWGNHPKGLSEVFDQLKKSTIDILRKNKNNVFYVDKLTKNGNPKHGQVWSYSNELLSFK